MSTTQMTNHWFTGRPPMHEELEVQASNGYITRARLYPADPTTGVLSHWKNSEYGYTYPPNKFRRWRRVQKEATSV